MFGLTSGRLFADVGWKEGMNPLENDGEVTEGLRGTRSAHQSGEPVERPIKIACAIVARSRRSCSADFDRDVPIADLEVFCSPGLRSSRAERRSLRHEPFVRALFA